MPNNDNILKGLKFIKNIKSMYERDAYLKLENIQKGSYYMLVHPDIDEISYVDQPEINVNIYGPSNVKFLDVTSSL